MEEQLSELCVGIVVLDQHVIRQARQGKVPEDAAVLIVAGPRTDFFGPEIQALEAYLGRDAFRDGVNAYLARFAYSNATSADFWTVMAASSRQPAR